MKPTARIRSFLGTALITMSSAHADTYIWANSNVTGLTPPLSLNWFNATQGTWTGGTPISSNLNTIQFFQDTTTALLNTGASGNTQASVIDNGGSAFQLGTLTLSGKASATTNANLTMNISGDPLNFSAATGTINLDALNAIRTITYNVNSNIQLGTASSAGALTLTGNGTSAFNIGGIISELQLGGGSLIKSGTSTVSLNGVNTYTGDTTIDAGTLKIGTAGSLGNGNYAGNISIASNAVLNFGNTAQTLSGDIANDGTLAFTGSGLNVVSGDISGSGSVNYNATINNANGTLTLSGNNTYTGKTSFGPGDIVSTITLSVSSFDYITSGSYANHGLGSSLGAPTTVADGTILIGVNGNGSKSASAVLKYTGSGETTDRVLTFAFSQTTAQRTIDASGSGLLKFTSPFTYTSGPSAITQFPAITLSGTGLGEMAAGITNLYTAGGLGLPVIKSGTGTWTLSGSNSYTGATTITQGTLQVSDLATPGSNSSVGASTGVGGLVLNGGTLRYTGASASTTRNFALFASSTIDASGTGALNFTSTVVSPDKTLSANFTSGQKVVTNLSSTADLVVGMRVLGTGVSSTIASIDSSTQITLAGNTTGVGSATPLAFGYTASARTLTLAGTNTDANTIAGILQDTSAAGAGVLNLAKSGVGTWVLGGANTYTGSTTLNAGTLKLDYAATDASKLSNTAVTGTLFLNGGTLELSGAGSSHLLETVLSTTLNTGGTFIKQTNSGNVDLSMGAITFTSGAIDFSADNIATTTTGVTNGILSQRATVAGTNFAMKSGSNIVAYDYATSGSTGYTGGTISANTNYLLTANGASTLSATTGVATATLKIGNTAIGSLAVDAKTLTVGAILFAGSANYDITTSGVGKIVPTLLHNYGTGGAVLNLGALGGALTQFGTGKTVLTAAATTAGGLTVNGGTVQISTNAQIGLVASGAAITLNNGTLLASETLALNNGGLNSRTITLGAGGGTLAAASTKTLTVSGVISGVGNPLTIGSATNTGTVTLTNANTYTGATNVTAGTLIINGSTSSTSLVTVASGATLGGSGTVAGAATISGTHNPGNSPGIQTFGSNLTYSGVLPSPVVNWELTGNTSTNVANPNAIFDQIIVGGNLDFANTTTLNLSFIAAGSNVLWADAFWDASQSWTLYDVAGTTSNFANLSLNTVNWLDSGSNLFSTTGGSFSLSQSGQDVVLNYTVVPEPNVAALLGGLGLLKLFRRRRK